MRGRKNVRLVQVAAVGLAILVLAYAAQWYLNTRGFAP